MLLITRLLDCLVPGADPEGRPGSRAIGKGKRGTEKTMLLGITASPCSYLDIRRNF